MYQALYRKWRPKTFDDVVGQALITETLKRQVVSGRLSHAYLFVGTRGTGKTTCAKVLSRAINCENPENGNPCNKCNSCVGIENGSILDVLELDAASNNGVDNVRALREEAVYTPADVKKRVYIIDEVHMLSTAAFNALLKILEEPPEHLIFILATTEIHKVPATILSRCQRFTFKRILPEQISERLQEVSQREGITLTADASELLARRADGSMRDALSLLDQCASDDTVDITRVVSAIGLADSTEIAALLTAISEYDTAAALSILDRLYTDGKVMATVLDELCGLVRDVLIMALMPKGGAGLLSGAFSQTALQTFLDHLSPERLMSAMEILRETISGLSKSTGGKLAVELCLIRLCNQQLGIDYSALQARIARLEALSSGAPAISTPRIQQPPPVHTPEKQAAPPPDVATQKARPLQQSTVSEAAADKPAVPSGVAIDDAASPQPTGMPDDLKTPAETGSGAQPAGDAWQEILHRIQNVVTPAQYSFLGDPMHAAASLDAGTLVIGVKNDFIMSMVNVPAVTSVLKEAAAAVMNKNMIIRFTLRSDSPETAGNKLDLLKDRFPGVVKVEE